MDNGQPIKQDNTQPFFATNTESLDFNNQDNQGDFTDKPLDNNIEYDSRNLGNTAIASSGNISSSVTDNNEAVLPMPGEEEKMGQVVNLEMPPNSANEVSVNTKEKDPVEAALSPNVKLEVKTTERLSHGGIKAVDDAIDKFAQDNNPTEFYETVRDLMEENLDNSYNRKLAA